MPESRDRLVRPGAIEPLFDPRRWVAGIPQDTGPQRGLFASPLRTVHGSGGGRNMFAGSLQRGSMANSVQRLSPGGPARRGRRRGTTNNSTLPSWYPRRPLRDVTEVVRAIERRRSRLVDPEHAQPNNPLPAPLEQNTNRDHAQLHNPLPAPLGQNTNQDQAQLHSPLPAPVQRKRILKTPKPGTGVKPCTPSSTRLSKILQDFDKNSADSDFITPQKKLLNSIEQVEKAVLEEFRKIEKSRSAKKVVRENKVRTLMSIR